MAKPNEEQTDAWATELMHLLVIVTADHIKSKSFPSELEKVQFDFRVGRVKISASMTFGNDCRE